MKKVFLALFLAFLMFPRVAFAAQCQTTQECANDYAANGRFTLNGCGRASGGNIICQPGGLGTIGGSTSTGSNSSFCSGLGDKQAACEECMGKGTDIKGSDTTGNVWTAIGCVKAGDPNQLISQLLGWAIVLGGGIAFLILVAAGIQMSLAAGDPKKVQAAKDLIMAAISGLVLIVFSLAIIKLLGFNVLGLGQFGFPNP